MAGRIAGARHRFPPQLEQQFLDYSRLSSRQLAIADGRMFAENGKLLAHATTSGLLFAVPTPAAS